MTEPVDIIIPHYKGSEKLLKCLDSLFSMDYENFRVIVVDNGCADDSVKEAASKFPQIIVLRLEKNLGFAGGCNAGVAYSDRDYIVLLNDDTEVDPGWLRPLVEKICSDTNIAVVQPKLRWILDKKKFDYAGAMGGLMDIYGYPFCYGRIFETIETDHGQYDRVDNIFWASGTASIFRRKLYLEAGGLDDSFFAHQEEIDLDWRLQLMGYMIKAEPRSIVYHYSGATLPPENFRKKYLNHRNSILMIIKNYELKNILWILPIRIGLELAAAGLAVKQRDYGRIFAIFSGGLWNLFNFPHLFASRRAVNKLRKVPDSEIFRRLYRGTIALHYYIGKKKNISEIYKIISNK